MLPFPSISCPACTTCHVPTQNNLKNGVYATNCENCGFFFKFRARAPTESTVTFTINQTQYTVGNEHDPATSLLEYMRKLSISPGTKLMCAEGGCGVCLVSVKLYEPVTQTKQIFTVNSCLVQLYACDGWEITTIEGLGNPEAGLHPIQERLAKYNGSQCGFCSPGFVMHMYGLLQRNPKPTMKQVEDALDSTICRCTGYRSIMDAMKSFAVDAPPSLPGGMIDIEDLNLKLCKKSGKPCTGKCSGKKDAVNTSCSESVKLGISGGAPLHIVGARTQWFKPTTLAELYLLLNQYRTDNYRLVFGNTGYGLFKDLGPWLFSILIDIRGIKELYDIKSNDSIELGANVTITNLIELFNNSSTTSTPYFPTFAAHLKLIATSTVKNAANWAGNLMLKHLHPEFVSDIYTIFETVGAKLIIGDGNGSQAQYSLADFLALDMRGKVIQTAILPTYSENNRYIRTYRVTRRTQSCDAYVTAGFNMVLDKSNNCTVVGHPTLVFQGISGVLNRASQTEGFLVGKQLADPQAVKNTVALLAKELVPSSIPGKASGKYRCCVASAFLYRFLLDVCSDKAAPRFLSGGTPLLRPVSTAVQNFDTNNAEWPLTEPLTRFEAIYQTSGIARFLDDTPWEATELHAAFVLSTQANAQIASIDPSVALTLPGVFKFIQASDLPPGGKNNSYPSYPGSRDEEILSSGQIYYAGQPIGIIVADDPETASTGAAMVNVTYKNVMPPVLDLEVAVQQKSFFPNPSKPLIVGNADQAIAQSAQKISGSIQMGNQYHFHLETHISRCWPSDDGGIIVQASTQDINSTASVVAKVLNIPQSSVTVEVVRLGGGFGAKINRSCIISGACALAAHIMRRPVRMRLDLHTNMKAIGKRLAYLAYYEAGFTNDGKLNGIKVDYYGDCGYSNNDYPNTFLYDHIDNAYYCPNWRVSSTAVKTNKPSNTACRSPGSLPAQFMMESIMEHISKQLQKDPGEVRKLNFYDKGQVTPACMKLNYCVIKDLVPQLETSSDLAARKIQVQQFNQANRWKKRGLSLVPTRFGIGYSGGHFNVIVAIYTQDGTIAIAHGGVEMGQGINIKVAQVCAYELGVPLSLIRIKKSSTISNANSSTTGGSITSELNCVGVIECCKILKTRMDPVRQRMSNPSWLNLVHECAREGLDLTAQFYTSMNDQYDFHYNVYAAVVTEVEVDVLTGQSQTLRVDMLYDCGESINPQVDIGQLEGGFLMGVGYHTTEKIIYDPSTGVLLTDGTVTYKPPLPKELPIDFRITLLRNAPNPLGVLRSKASGEPPVMLSASVLFAIKHAIEAARAEIGQDTFFTLNSPATVEAVQLACSVGQEQFTLGQ